MTSLSRGNSSRRANTVFTGISFASGTWPALYSWGPRTSMTVTLLVVIISLPSSTLIREKGSRGSLLGIRHDLLNRRDSLDSALVTPESRPGIILASRRVVRQARRGDRIREEVPVADEAQIRQLKEKMALEREK